MKQTPKLLILVSLLVGAGCRSVDENSAPKFGWEEDLTPDAPVDPSTIAPWPKSKSVDSNFCKSLDPGTCMTLVIRIPSIALVNQLGLSTLALGDQSNDMAMRMQEACGAAWENYQSRYKDDGLRPLRQKFVRKISKMRCIFRTMSQESATEDLKLESNEIALSVRLTKFDIEGKNRSSKIGVLELAADSTSVTTEFRSIFLYGGKKVADNQGTWVAAKGLPLGVLSSKESIDKAIKWNVSVEAVKAELGKIDFATAPAAADQATKAFFTQAKANLASVSAATTPVGASLVLVGIGFSAYKSLCGESSERCVSELKTENKTEAVASGLKEVVPTSDAIEAFRMALIHSVQGILNKSFETIHTTQVNQVFDLD